MPGEPIPEGVDPGGAWDVVNGGWGPGGNNVGYPTTEPPNFLLDMFTRPPPHTLQKPPRAPQDPPVIPQPPPVDPLNPGYFPAPIHQPGVPGVKPPGSGTSTEPPAASLAPTGKPSPSPSGHPYPYVPGYIPGYKPPRPYAPPRPVAPVTPPAGPVQPIVVGRPGFWWDPVDFPGQQPAPAAGGAGVGKPGKPGLGVDDSNGGQTSGKPGSGGGRPGYAGSRPSQGGGQQQNNPPAGSQRPGANVNKPVGPWRGPSVFNPLDPAQRPQTIQYGPGEGPTGTVNDVIQGIVSGVTAYRPGAGGHGTFPKPPPKPPAWVQWTPWKRPGNPWRNTLVDILQAKPPPFRWGTPQHANQMTDVQLLEYLDWRERIIQWNASVQGRWPDQVVPVPQLPEGTIERLEQIRAGTEPPMPPRIVGGRPLDLKPKPLPYSDADTSLPPGVLRRYRQIGEHQPDAVSTMTFQGGEGNG